MLLSKQNLIKRFHSNLPSSRCPENQSKWQNTIFSKQFYYYVIKAGRNPLSKTHKAGQCHKWPTVRLHLIIQSIFNQFVKLMLEQLHNMKHYLKRQQSNSQIIRFSVRSQKNQANKSSTKTKCTTVISKKNFLLETS